MPTPPKIMKLGPYDLTSVGNVLAVIPVGEWTHLSIQAVDGGGSTRWATGTPASVGVKWANDATGTIPLDFSTAVNLTMPNTGVGMDSASELDVSRVAFVALVVDTAEANTKGTFYICAKDNRGA